MTKKKDSEKVSVELLIDEDVISGFRATGRGWKTRMNDMLPEYLQNQHWIKNNGIGNERL